MNVNDFLSELDAPDDLIKGIEKGEKKLEDFTTFFKSTFIARSMATDDDELRSKVAGKALNGIAAKLKTIGGFDNKDVKDKKPEEIADMISSKWKSDIETLKADVGKGSDEAVRTWQNKAEKLEKEKNEYKSLADKTLEDLTSERGSHASTIKNFKIDHIVGSVKSKIPFKDGMTEAEQYFFENKVMKENYVFDIGEKDEFIVSDKSGNRVKSSTGNKFASIEDILLDEAKKHNLIKMQNTRTAAPAWGSPAPSPIPPFSNGNGSTHNGTPSRTPQRRMKV